MFENLMTREHSCVLKGLELCFESFRKQDLCHDNVCDMVPRWGGVVWCGGRVNFLNILIYQPIFLLPGTVPVFQVFSFYILGTSTMYVYHVK